MPTRLAHLFLGRPRTRQQHYDALDGLRGLAVLIVIASHLSLLGFGLVPGLPVGGIGKSGVYLFFVLSAFLLTRLLLERTPARFADGRLWVGYAMRRVLRIWPLYLVVLALAWAITRAGAPWWHYQLDGAAVLRHLALREGYSVLWSIPVEFKFYLWLPLMALALAWMAARRWPLPAQALVWLAALALATWAWPPSQTGINDVRLGPYLPLFLAGGAAAAIDLRIGHGGASRGWGIAGLLACAAFVLTLPETWAALSGTPVDHKLTHTWFVFFGVTWATLLLAVLHGPRWLRAPFAWAPMRLLGVVSFSAYLWHMPVLYGMAAMGAGDWPLAGWWVFAATLLLSMASFLLVERPWRDVRLPADAKISRVFPWWSRT
ncbi:MAG: acyltransferase [Lysobacteraceae bacterium]|nr:MAG: acyltransferase [Xanthomonadaceae bacterium]